MLRTHEGHDHHDHAMSEPDKEALADFIWRQESVTLTTVGIDIGTSTSHLLFSKVILQRPTQQLSSSFVVIHREVLWQSPIVLTRFLPDGLIDEGYIGEFIRDCYKEAGLRREDVDSGAVILTGEVIKRKNARVIDELFADEAGKFVCATAGHKLESVLAAHGSGAVQLSKEKSACVLHADVGGGTTKLALIRNGQILDVAAFAVGGRLIAQDDSGRWSRIDDSAHLVIEDLGFSIDPETLADEKVRLRFARRLANVVVDYLQGSKLDRLGMALQLTESLQRSASPEFLTFSGGVAEYILNREISEYGDVAQYLADELKSELNERLSLPVLDPGRGIWATVLGASQFTVQVSGKTIYLPDHSVLPIHNIPVIYPELDLSHETVDPSVVSQALLDGFDKMDLNAQDAVAIALRWKGDPLYHRLEALARGIMKALTNNGRRTSLLILVIDGDMGKLLGRLLEKDLGLTGGLVSIDGIQLRELDFVDIGEYLDPPGVVPVVIKSLLFG